MEANPKDLLSKPYWLQLPIARKDEQEEKNQTRHKKTHKNRPIPLSSNSFSQQSSMNTRMQQNT